MSIIVLFGGTSDERHVSVASAQNIGRALSKALYWFQSPTGAVYDVALADLLAHQRPFELDFEPSRPAIWPDLDQALDTLPVEDPVFLLALHGGEGENGLLQLQLEQRGIPFTGSGSEASAVAFEKARAKEAMQGRVPLAESRVGSIDKLRDVVADMFTRHERLVLKPLAGGSSRGLFFLNRGDDIPNVDVPYIVEEFVHGREVTVGVVDMGDGPFPLPCLEIEFDPNRTFDYEGKYLGQGTREICPANIPEHIARESQRIALEAHNALGCRGYSRTDVVAGENEVWFLELNTLPGLTAASLLPQQLKAAHIDFRDFLERQVQLARA
jgi:D-alanine-D-alanine ligase